MTIMDGYAVYTKMKQTMDDLNLAYTESEDALEIMCQFTAGEDIQELFLRIRPEQQMLRILSILPGTFPEELLTEAALACCAVNKDLGIGQFSCHWEQKKIVFMITSTYQGCTVGSDWFEHQITWTHIILTKYETFFRLFGEGSISLKEFIENIEKL